MDLNYLLIWTVSAGCGLTLLQLPWNRRGLRLAGVPALILVVLGISLLTVPDRAGYVSGGMYFLLMLLPVWGMSLLNSLLQKKRYREAGWLARALTIVRPDRDFRLLPSVLRAIRLAQSRRPTEAIEILRGLAGGEGSSRRSALILLTRLTGDWQQLLDWAARPENSLLVQSDPVLLENWFQAWGETGQRDMMFLHYEQLQPVWRSFPEFVLPSVQLKLAAFSGDERTVVQLLQGHLADLPPEVKSFWRATAAQVAGHTEEAARDFRSLAQSRDASIARFAQRRLDQPLSNLNSTPLAADQLLTLQLIARQAAAELQQGTSRLIRSRQYWGTWGLVGLLGLVFLCELPGGSENFENLERMGAMLIPARSGTDFLWRMVAAAFLHFGLLHLVMNVLGLFVLGRRIEQEWGTGRMLITYLLSAIGSIGLAPWFVTADPEFGTITLVGASGGVMGLLGGLLMQSLVHLLQGRSRLAGREFLTLLAIVLMQITFDANTPNVSSEAHLLGMSIGIACGAVWNLIWLVQRRSQRGLLRCSAPPPPTE